MSDDQPTSDVDRPRGGVRDKAWWDAHPEEKEKQRQRAQELVRQGKFGGANNGRRKKRPAYEVAAAKAADNASKLAEELFDQALHAPSKRERLQAIKLLMDMEHRVRQERRDEEDHFAKLSGDELTAELFNALREITGMDEFDVELGDDDVEEFGVNDQEADVRTQGDWPNP